MELVGLISGGKDSIYAILEAVRMGHSISVLANLRPFPEVDLGALCDLNALDEKVVEDLDSHMFQTVGHTTLPSIANAMGIPLVRGYTSGKSNNLSLEFEFADKDAKNAEASGTQDALTNSSQDEIEDLYSLLLSVKERFPSIQGVACGAILSNYQRQRVEVVCKRLGLIPISLLWHRQQRTVLDDMYESGVRPFLVKVSTYGLNRRHLGRCLFDSNIRALLLKLEAEIGINIAGEGGEYETLTLDSPLYVASLEVQESTIEDATRDVANLKITGLNNMQKTEEEREKDKKRLHPNWLPWCRILQSEEKAMSVLVHDNAFSTQAAQFSYDQYTRYSTKLENTHEMEENTAIASQNLPLFWKKKMDFHPLQEGTLSQCVNGLSLYPYCSTLSNLFSDSTKELTALLTRMQSYFNDKTKYSFTDCVHVDILCSDYGSIPALLAVAKRFWGTSQPLFNVACVDFSTFQTDHSDSDAFPNASVAVRVMFAPPINTNSDPPHDVYPIRVSNNVDISSVSRFFLPNLGLGAQLQYLATGHALIGTTFGLCPETLTHPLPTKNSIFTPVRQSLVHLFPPVLSTFLPNLLIQLRRMCLNISHVLQAAERSWLDILYSEFFVCIPPSIGFAPDEIQLVLKIAQNYLLTWGTGHVGTNAKISLLDVATFLYDPIASEALWRNDYDTSSDSDSDWNQDGLSAPPLVKFSSDGLRRGIFPDTIRQSNDTEYCIASLLDPVQEHLFGPVSMVVHTPLRTPVVDALRQMQQTIESLSNRVDVPLSVEQLLLEPLSLLAFEEMDGIDLLTFRTLWRAFDSPRKVVNPFAFQVASFGPFDGCVHSGTILLSQQKINSVQDSHVYSLLSSVPDANL